MQNNEIIIALATPPGTSAVGIVRLSGKGCIEMADSVFSKDLIKKKSHTIHYGQIVHENEVIDDCLVSIFRAPTSYTKEDSIEISCHGSPFILEKVIKLFLILGAKPATNGEYTKRAFLNGQLDLSQAEAVADLIAADSELSHSLALRQLRGGFSNDLQSLRQKLIDFASLIELELDFGEEDVEFASRSDLESTVIQIAEKIEILSESFNLGNSIKNGIPVVIAGKPNAGKSTLLNALMNSDRAIVSAIPGTTRDTIDDVLNIAGVKFLITDTAGIRSSQDEIEQIGVSKTLDKISSAQVLLYVVDVLDSNPNMVWQELKKYQRSNCQTILVLNKMDLYPNLQPKNFIKENLISEKSIIPISAINKMNMSVIKERLISFVNTENVKNNTMITNVRHYDSLENALGAINSVLEGLKNKVTGDFLAMDIRQALHYLGLITGEVHTDDLLDNIFSNFCIGK